MEVSSTSNSPVIAPAEGHAFFEQPIEDGAGFGIADLLHGGVKGGLAEAFLEDASGMQEFVRNDGVEHSHAAFIEDAEDCLVPSKFPGGLFAELFVGDGQFEETQVFDVALVVGDNAFGEPLPQASFEIGVGKIFAPQRAVADAGFGERAVEIQHADQPGPGAAPIGERQNRSFVG